MEKINRFLKRSKTFNSYDRKNKREQGNNNKHSADDDDDVAVVTVTNTNTPQSQSDTDRPEKITYYDHLAKVSNPSDPQGTLKRLETENLRRPKIKQITGLERNSLSSEDITIRNPTASPKPARHRTKTMFDFLISKSKKSPLPTKKPSLKASASTSNLQRSQLDNTSTLTVPQLPPRKDSANTVSLKRKPAELSSIDIDISDPVREKDWVSRVKQLQFTRTYSRSMNDVMKLTSDKSVRVLKEKFEDVPIMGRVSLINKTPTNVNNTLSTSSKRRSSLPVDFKDLPNIKKKDKRDKAMANQQQQVQSNNQGVSSIANQKSPNVNEFVPKSPTQKISGDISNEDNQNAHKTSTNRKSIKNILQKFLSRRPSQQDLVTKGIIQVQRIYGNSLKNLCRNMAAGAPKVPEFVSVVMAMIEETHNVVSHGIYRASGNIATIHKIRVKVNEGKDLDILKEYRKETDVLTGSLKLFFRELKEPLISTEMFNELCDLKDKELTDHDRLQTEVDRIIKRQPEHHRDVITALITHILYVNSFGDKNSMSIDSMSIVWGPSLIFTDNEQDGGMLLQRMTNNNSVVRFLLNVYNRTYTPTKHIPPQRLYSSESTLSLASTSDKGSTSRPSFKQQHSVDDPLSIEDLEQLIKSIQDSELAKKHNIYVMFKGKKSKKITDRIKAKKSIEKYTTTKDGLCSIVDTLKKCVSQSSVVPEEFIKDYDGGTLHSKEIETTLERLSSTNQRILELILNHLNDMRRINREKYSLELLVPSWTKVLFNTTIAENSPIAEKYLEQLLEYYERSKEFKIAQSTRRKDVFNDLSESLLLRSTRLSESETSLDEEVQKRNSTNPTDVEIRKSVKVHKEEEEQRRSNRKS